jgi:hypothetical protein
MSAALGDLVLFGLVPALALLWLVLLALGVRAEMRRLRRLDRARVSRWVRERPEGGA